MEYNIQIIVAVACWVIAIMFLVQVGVWVGLYLVARKLQGIVEDMRAKFEPKVAQVMTTVTELQATVKEVTETVSTVSTEVRAVSAAVTSSAERISVLATEGAEEIRETITRTSAEIKDLVSTTSGDVKGLVRNTSSDVQDLVRTTSGDVRSIIDVSKQTAHGAAERMDLMVERTALRVEETGAFVQSQVLDPVREVSAIVVGIKVALETLLGYPERKQINQAYSEEELFI
jgi:gas vesicle protein